MGKGQVTRNNKNIYLPFKASIKEVLDTRCDVKLFRVTPGLSIDYSPGQFFMVSLWGAGEAPISVTSTKKLQRHIEFGIKKVGTVTTALHRLKKGDTIWLRGPFGNGFNADIAKRKDVVFVSGGIGLVPLRSLINFMIMHKKQYKNLYLLYGAKNPFEILFEKDIKSWDKKGIQITLTVDARERGWRGNEGLVTDHLDKIKTDFKNACSYLCGPDVMIKKVMEELSSRGMSDRHIITTLEARMKCGVGKCGQCYSNGRYLCTNGPVFSYAEIKQFGISHP
jgi:NAD(P)H-flavin reductase